MRCTVLADNQDKWTQASLGLNKPHNVFNPMTWPQQPAASTVCQLFTAHQDLSIFKESQKNGPGDPWLQARDNLKMEPSLTCLEPPTPEQLIKEGNKAGLFPIQGTILSPDNDADGL